MFYVASFFLPGRCWCLTVSSGYEVNGSKMALADKDACLWYLLDIKNKELNRANLIESLLGINYMVNGTLKAVRDNWTWKAYIFHLYWCGDAAIKRLYMCLEGESRDRFLPEQLKQHSVVFVHWWSFMRLWRVRGDKWCLFQVKQPQCTGSHIQFTIMDLRSVWAYFD